MDARDLKHLPSHFQGKEAIDHVIENQVKGYLSQAEVHGTETPGHIMAGLDTARETAVISILILLILQEFNLPFKLEIFPALMGFFVGWLIWKTGRSAWLGWCRLERLHRVMAEEKWEIEHHRAQEREELGALYRAKGFQGKLLEDVLDVLMSDGDRILKVMLEEELGLTLENQEHPLKQGLGALIGGCVSILLILITYYFLGFVSSAILAFILVMIAAYITASFEKNRKISAMIWSLGIAVFATGSCFFAMHFVKALF